MTQLPRNDRHLNLRLPPDLYDKALAAATAEQRPLSSWVRKLVHRELADRLSADMDAEDSVTYNAGGGLEIGLPIRTSTAIPEGEAYAVSSGIDPETNQPKISAVKLTGVGKKSKCKHPVLKVKNGVCLECGQGEREVMGGWPVKRGTFNVTFVEYTETGVTLHYEAELELAVYKINKVEYPIPLNLDSASHPVAFKSYQPGTVAGPVAPN